MSGMRGVNPRQMKQAMKKMGITSREIDDAYEVVIRTRSKDIVISSPSISVMSVQGQDTYQIAGAAREVEPGGSAAEPAAQFPVEDVELVMSQTGCSSEDAVKALEACGGQPAEAILKMMTE